MNDVNALLRQAAMLDALADKDAEHADELAAYQARQDVLLRGITEALDSLDRLATEPSAERLRLVGRQLVATIQAADCAVIGARGEIADPATHQVIEVRHGGDEPDDTVVEVLSRGYRSPDQVVPAKVIITATNETKHEERE
ncbi:MAG TPA: nucleotide exchange factor GrpE [Pseudonocardiaceae bacterium]|jgi:molecular chaperone GrpE|nr:nucleotide exchange factor GrpE [Pseudonocardiaceae bacterium]